MRAAGSLPRRATPRGARAWLPTDRLAARAHRRLSAKEPGRRHASVRCGHAGFGGFAVMKEIVLVTLTVYGARPNGPQGPVHGQQPPGAGRAIIAPYEDEPRSSQFRPGECQVCFEADLERRDRRLDIRQASETMLDSIAAASSFIVLDFARDVLHVNDECLN
jgi:hypothetical protein